MLLKIIECWVRPRLRDQFARGQTAWRALRDVAGFRGQVGGWIVDDPMRAVIFGFWENAELYRAFMDSVHDAIFDANGQRDTYDPRRSHTSLWRPVADSALDQAISASRGRLSNVVEIWYVCDRTEKPLSGEAKSQAQLSLPPFQCDEIPQLLNTHFFEQSMDSVDAHGWIRVTVEPDWIVESDPG